MLFSVPNYRETRDVKLINPIGENCIYGDIKGVVAGDIPTIDYAQARLINDFKAGCKLSLPQMLDNDRTLRLHKGDVLTYTTYEITRDVQKYVIVMEDVTVKAYATYPFFEKTTFTYAGQTFGCPTIYLLEDRKSLPRNS